MLAETLKQQVKQQVIQSLAQCGNAAAMTSMLQGMSLVSSLAGQSLRITPEVMLEVVSELAASHELPLLLQPPPVKPTFQFAPAPVAPPPPAVVVPAPQPPAAQPVPGGWQPVQTNQTVNGQSFPLPTPSGREYVVTPTPPAAIIIAGRNNGRYLHEAIMSAMTQTVPCEVVYSDDCSDDDSLVVASRFVEQGLRILPSRTHQGVCATRNRGVRATKAPYLVHLDSDDHMPSDFVQRHLDAMTHGTPYVYGPAQAFGDRNSLWKVPDWNGYDLWRHNTVNTSAMYARTAFMAAGGWQESYETPTMWDFDLAIRASRFGTPKPSTATLNYRQHSDGFSTSLNERSEEARSRYAELIRRKNAQVCIASVVSGRMPSLFPKWLNAVRSTALFAHLPRKPQLLLMLHDKALDAIQPYLQMINGCDDIFESVEIHGIRHNIPQTPEQDRRDNVSMMLADASSRIQGKSPADIVWTIEDDIIVPRTALQIMFEAMTAGSLPPIGVSGFYRNRHVPEKLLGGYMRGGEHVELTKLDEYTSEEVDFTGTGCLMFWTGRPGSPQSWRSHYGRSAAHDWAWAADRKGALLQLKSVCCEHHASETEIFRV